MYATIISTQFGVHADTRLKASMVLGDIVASIYPDEGGASLTMVGTPADVLSLLDRMRAEIVAKANPPTPPQHSPLFDIEPGSQVDQMQKARAQS